VIGAPPDAAAPGTGAARRENMAQRNTEAIIVNCSTREQTTLALVSALRHARLPVTVIDCESTDGSPAFFRALQERLPFRLAQMPLRRHGETLDRLFRESDRDALLLVDSDAEILRGDLVPAMLAGLDAGAYGSGFLHRGEWLGSNHLVERNVGYYAPRMWIPCVMLAVKPVRTALAAGETFRARMAGNEIPQLPWLSQLLHLRFRVPGLRRLAFERLRGLRRTHFGVQPHYVYYDTGAALHDYLTQQQLLPFADLGADLWPLAVRHYHGVTRRRLARRMRNAADPERTRREAVERIETLYGVAVPELRG
jgi:glycosyltransferase involved in cell wall biosynthesis